MERNVSRFEDLLRASVDWTWETDSHFRIVALSPGFDSTLGKSGSTMIGKSLPAIADRARPSDEESARNLEKALANRRPFRHLPLTLANGENHRVSFLISGLAYYDSREGSFLGHRGTAVRAASVMARAELDSQTNRQLLRLLEAALGRKDELERFNLRKLAKEDWAKMGSLAHELRTPLNAIVGFAEIIRDQRFGEDPERYRHYAGLVHDSAHHLLDVVQDLADLTDREQRQPDAAEDGLIDPLKVASFVLIVMDEEALRKDLALVNDLPPALPRVRAERRTLRQILFNLVDNAVKYTDPGGQVRLSATTVEGKSLALRVSDTGVGIAPEDRERIFERHVRAAPNDQTTKGKGLGLSIARDLARGLGGDIEVEGRPGKGSTFTLILPLTESGKRKPDDGDKNLPEPKRPSSKSEKAKERARPNKRRRSGHLSAVPDDSR